MFETLAGGQPLRRAFPVGEKHSEGRRTVCQLAVARRLSITQVEGPDDQRPDYRRHLTMAEPISRDAIVACAVVGSGPSRELSTEPPVVPLQPIALGDQTGNVRLGLIRRDQDELSSLPRDHVFQLLG